MLNLVAILLVIGGMSLMLYALYWLYSKGKKIGYQEGKYYAEKICQEKLNNLHKRLSDRGYDGFRVQSKDKPKVSAPGAKIRLE